MIATFAFAAAAQAALCLQDVFAPEVTGVPPTYAHREMCRMDDGEIRHYGQVMRGGKVCRVYASSRDEGLSWRLFAAKEDDVGALVKSPWSGEWLTVCSRDGVKAVRSKKGPSAGDAVFTPVEAPGFVFFRQPQPLAEKGHWICAGAAINRDPKVCPGSQCPAVLLSADDGRTWRMVALTNVVTQASEPKAPDAVPRWENYCCEPTVDQRRDGTLQMFVRTSTDHNWRYLSRDGGETWTGPEKLPHFFSCNTMPTFLRLKDGRLLYFWNNTVPLPKLPSLTGQVLNQDEACGRWETVFTNRDALHAAISEDDGETWTGFREIRLNEHRNDVDYRELGNDPAQEHDKSVHQSQALELPGGKVLLAAGQNSAVRRFVVFDPAWLYETTRDEDFRHGLGNVSHFLYVKGPVGGARGWAGHCTWNRVPGARMVFDPDLPADQREVAKLVRRRDEDLVSDLPGLVWNFPAARKGRVEVECRVAAGGEGFRFALSDHWFNPCDRYASEHAPAAWEVRDVPPDRWLTVVAEWSGERVVFSVDGKPVAERKMSAPPRFGLSYLHLQLLAEKEDLKGVFFRRLHKE